MKIKTTQVFEDRAGILSYTLDLDLDYQPPSPGDREYPGDPEELTIHHAKLTHVGASALSAPIHIDWDLELWLETIGATDTLNELIQEYLS